MFAFVKEFLLAILGVAGGWGAALFACGLLFQGSIFGLTRRFVEHLHPLARFVFFLIGCTASDLGCEAGLGVHMSKRRYPYGTGIALGLAVGILAAFAPGISFYLFLASLVIVAAPFAVRLHREPSRPRIRDLDEALDAVFAVPPSTWTVHFHVPGPLAQFFEDPYLYLQAFASDGRRLRLVRFQNSLEYLQIDDAETHMNMPFPIVAKRHKLIMQRCRDSTAEDLSQGRDKRVNRVICSLLDDTLKLLP